MDIYFHKIKFDDLDLVLRLFKKEGRSLELVLSYFENPETIAKIKEVYPSVEAVNVRDILKLTNAEQRMIALSTIPHEEILGQLDAKLVNRQTVKKKQTRWDEQLKPYVYEYDDCYELYSFSGEALGIKSNRMGSNKVPEIYMVKCKCTSTGRTYYQYVPHYIGEEKDAIKAIAWTFSIGYSHLTKEQYLHFMYSET
ncbi:hypothetical protein [Sporocytophaga myxococcoides]|uniref:hypothetical protein n=1 Tax=Sporocytophaga myxococcoides TaxID=153721 RepID=UPI000402AB8E|nr:hypothetical protein [Sporocytophaga myxococcoides]